MAYGTSGLPMGTQASCILACSSMRLWFILITPNLNQSG